MYIGVQCKFNVNLIIKNDKKTPQQEKVLVDTFTGEGVHVYAKLQDIKEYI